MARIHVMIIGYSPTGPSVGGSVPGSVGASVPPGLVGDSVAESVKL